KLLFILLLFVVQANASLKSQTITLEFTDTPLEKVLGEVKKQSGYSYIANTKLLKEAKKVTVRVSNAELDETLRTIFQDQPLYAEVSNGMIYVKSRRRRNDNTKTSAHPSLHVLLQMAVQGKVTDTLGVALTGISVLQKGRSAQATSTDLNGRYVIDVPGDAVLVFSMVGYETQELPVNGKSQLNVVMKASTSQLDDVVVVGFGRQKRTDMIGSVVSVKPEQLKVPSSNLTTALAGRVAGMIAFQRSGEPGMDNADFFIRGVTTFGYKVDPLILIDNVEVTTTDLARLQVDDIADFSIMKDATATAVYGARGANG